MIADNKDDDDGRQWMSLDDRRNRRYQSQKINIENEQRTLKKTAFLCSLRFDGPQHIISSETSNC